MTEDYGAEIIIGGERYEMILTTKATKAINKRYGGLEKLGDKISDAANFEEMVDEIVWLITLLVNQSIHIHNIRHRDDQKELLTEGDVEILTTPIELMEGKNAIMQALLKGTKRHIESEENEKNTAVG